MCSPSMHPVVCKLIAPIFMKRNVLLVRCDMFCPLCAADMSCVAPAADADSIPAPILNQDARASLSFKAILCL